MKMVRRFLSAKKIKNEEFIFNVLEKYIHL